MRYTVIDKDKKQYKAELHCHSTLSDGKYTPEEVKNIYLERGFSVVAFTDHEVFADHSALCDSRFVALNGSEIQLWAKDAKCWDERKIWHFCIIAKEQAYRTDLKFLGHFLSRSTDKAAINEMIALLNEKGFLVTLNHPNWSLLTADDIIGCQGLFGVEIYNSFAESVMHFYRLLQSGQTDVKAIAANDFHRFEWGKYADWQKGAVYIEPDAFDYGGIVGALERGSFYASTGPVIDELYVEDGKAVLSCSEAESIVLTGLGRYCKRLFGSKDEPLTNACFELSERTKEGFFVIIKDFGGNIACTNYIKDIDVNALVQNADGKADTLFISDPYSSGDVGFPDFSTVENCKITLAEQFDFIKNTLNTVECKRCVIQFSSAEIFRLDIIYETGVIDESDFNAYSAELLREFKVGLKDLTEYLKDRAIDFKFVSFRPQSNSPDVYNYRNYYAKMLNGALADYGCIDVFEDLSDGETLKDEYRGGAYELNEAGKEIICNKIRKELC